MSRPFTTHDELINMSIEEGQVLNPNSRKFDIQLKKTGIESLHHVFINIDRIIIYCMHG